MKAYRPVALIILDGLGIREMAHGNAVVQANTPNYDRWTRERERTIVDASGEAVGLPDGQMGNSEVGHLNLGAGRVIYQDLTRINLAIDRSSFAENGALLTALAGVRSRRGKLHLVGLFGEGGVHSHSKHLYALLQMAERAGVTAATPRRKAASATPCGWRSTYPSTPASSPRSAAATTRWTATSAGRGRSWATG